MTELQQAIKHLKIVDPVLGAVIARLGNLEQRKRPRSYYMALVRAIISQQLSVAAAATIFKRFTALFPGVAFPKPEVVLQVRDEELRAAGLSHQKISYIKDLSDRVVTGKLHLKKFSKMNNQAVIDELTAVKGVGVWTAEMFLMFSLRRPDVFSFGDLGLKNAMIKVYNLPKDVTNEQRAKIVLPWSPYRTYAARFLWQSLTSKLPLE